MLILYIRVLSVPLQSGPEIFYICQWRWASWNVLQEGKRSWLVTQSEISDSSPTLALPGLSIPGLPPRQLRGGTNFLFPLLHFQLLTFLFSASFSFEGHSNHQGRSWVQQIRAQGTHITSFTRPSVPSASSAFLAGHCGLGASLSLAGSEFNHLTPCCSAKVCFAAQDCIWQEQITNAANWMLPVIYHPFYPSTLSLCSEFPFSIFFECWREVTFSVPLHLTPERRWIFLRAILYVPYPHRKEI